MTTKGNLGRGSRGACGGTRKRDGSGRGHLRVKRTDIKKRGRGR